MNFNDIEESSTRERDRDENELNDEKNKNIKSFLSKATIKSNKSKSKRAKSKKNTDKMNKSENDAKSIKSKGSQNSRKKKASRKDRYGSPITKKGKQRISFRDKIKDENNENLELCDVVNISLVERKSIVEAVPLLKKINSIASNSDMMNNINNQSKENHLPVKKKSDPKANSANKDENCSCLCFIF